MRKINWRYFCVLFAAMVACNPALAEEIKVNILGAERNLILDYPANRSNKPVPLVMIFHGGGGNASWMRRNSQDFEKPLLKAGYAVAFMNGTGQFLQMHTWNAKYCCGYAARHNIDDVSYIDAAIEAIAKQYLIDMDNIFLVGHSNGGMISYLAPSALHHKVKGIVVASSAVFEGQPPPRYPLSLLMIQSKDDEIIPYGGGISKNRQVFRTQTKEFLPFEASVDIWKRYLGCSEEVSYELSVKAMLRTADCSAGNFLRVLQLETGGHKWNKDLKGVSMPAVILQFLDDARNNNLHNLRKREPG